MRPRFRRYWYTFCLTGAIVYGLLSLFISTDTSSGQLSWRVSIAPRRDVQRVKDGLERDRVTIGFDAFGYREPYQFWNDNGAIATRVRSADVVFLGSSRAQFAYDQPRLLAELQRQNLSVYNLSFGCNENIGFGVELLERYQATPSVLIINLDLNMFRRKFSRCTRDVVTGGGAIAFQHQRFAQAVQFAILNRLNHLIARVTTPKFDHYFLPHYLLVRANDHGFWATDVFETRAQAENVTPIVLEPDPECQRSLDTEEQANIDYWRDRLEKLNPNATILFTYIPHDRFCSDRLAAVAEYFNAPGFQVSKPDRLETFDSSHLTRESAHYYTDEFMQWLERLYPALGAVIH